MLSEAAKKRSKQNNFKYYVYVNKQRSPVIIVMPTVVMTGNVFTDDEEKNKKIDNVMN